jgi:two-component system cell cycle sensor histidine kinase/response regulator CckA
VRRLPPRHASGRRAPSRRLAGGTDRFDTLLELAADWYWETDAAFRFTTMRPKAGLRMPLPELGSSAWDAGSECTGNQLAAMRRAMAARASFDAFECAGLDAGGRLRHAHVSGRPAFDAGGAFLGYRGIGRDVTAQKEAEQALNASESQLAAVIDAAMDAIVTVDEDGRVALFNPAASDMFGCSRAQALGAALDTWLPQAQQFIQGSHGRRAAAFGPLVRGLALQGRRSDGQAFHAEATISRIQVQGRWFYCLTARDLTRALAAEEARQSLESQLQQSQKMEALGTLAGGIAHDFNNIVAAILGNARLARDRAEPGSAVLPFIGEIASAGQRARDLVQRILSFSRNQAGTRLVCQPLQPLVEEGVQLLRAMLPAGIELVHPQPPEPLQACVDATQLHQVLMNLGTNAWQAIRQQCGRVAITLERAGDEACLSVADNGCGMDAATVERIFEPFFTTKAKGEGTGLGLPVVHGIVHAHGGRITLETRPGEGTTFHVWLPLAGSDCCDAVVAHDAAEAGSPDAAGRGRHVLYLDDYPAMVLMVKAMLEAQGYRVTGFEDPVAALDWMRAHPAEADLLVTDYNMPGCSGLELTSLVRKLRPGLPVVLTSGYLTDDLHRAAAVLGVQHVFDKPRGVEELCRVVGEVLAAAEAGTGSR